jgi:hypothetical protein
MASQHSLQAQPAFTARQQFQPSILTSTPAKKEPTSQHMYEATTAYKPA